MEIILHILVYENHQVLHKLTSYLLITIILLIIEIALLGTEDIFPKWEIWSLDMLKVLPTVKGKRLRPELGFSRFYGPAKQMHTEFCLSPLNLYLVS